MTLIPQEDKDVHEARQRARQLYEQGLALDAIARSVKTSVMSVLPWRGNEDEGEDEGEAEQEPNDRNPLASARDRGCAAAVL
jgi:hypothetical protein